MDELPNTVTKCDGCEEDLNLLHPYLQVQVKAGRKVLVVEEEVTEDPNVVGDANIYLGDKTGRGVMLKLHGFDCLTKWSRERKGKFAVIEVHAEDEIYEPEDNREPEELVKTGDLPEEMLAVYKASAKAAEGGGE